MKNLFIKKLIFLLFISMNAISQDGSFSFTISSSVNTSAGVFKDDSILVRTLWNNIKYTPGTYTKYWDGKDDRGVTISNPASTYKVKVLSNNVQYTWQGTVGNTSDSMTGSTKHQGYYNCMTGLVFASNGYGYFCNGFSEGEATYSKLLTAKPQAKVNYFATSSSRILTLNTEFVATDNVNVYWAGYDSYSKDNSMVHAIRTSDDANVIFANGVPHAVAHGITLPSVISKVTLPNVRITGLAVQKNNGYLFVARSTLNQLQVLNKTTGALVQTLTVASPRGLCVDAGDNLWMISGTNSIAKYTVNVNGTISTATLTLSGLLDPLAVQVSPDGSTVVVADGSTSQQMKAFNNSTGAATWTLGTAGGYVADATVTDNKFYLYDNNTTHDISFHSFIAFQPDGTFWVNDPGNFRVQHYNANRVFMNRIMALGTTYSTFADPNNPTKLFAGPLEFSIDYNATLTGSTGWALVKNWGANLTATYLKPYLTYPTTLSNGRTYAILVKPGGSNNREFVELPSTGQLRPTGVFRTAAQIMAPDGSIQVLNKATLGGVTTIFRYAFTGFNSSNGPTWSSTPEVLATTPALTIDDPNDILTGNCVTSTNKVIIWNPDIEINASTPYTGYHLGAIGRNKNSWLWKTEKATHKNYNGPYPPAGFFDIGNAVHNNAGGTLSILGRNVITSYHGEFWKNTQTNKYNHYMDNGLAVGQFGVVKGETRGNAPAMYAGNALTPMVVADPNSVNSLYLYHGDESTHSGVHRWKISGLNSISEQVVTIPFPSSYLASTPGYVDLMAGLPFGNTLQNNTAGWTRFPVSDDTSQIAYKTWEVNTSRLSYQSVTSNDISLAFQSPDVATNTVSRDLGINNVTTSWTITGEVIFPSQNNPNGQFAQQYLEVLDANNKVLTTFYLTSLGFYGNAVLLGSFSGSYNLFPFEVKIVSGVVTFTVAGNPPVTTTISDATGNWKTPKTLRVRMLRNSLNNPARYQATGIKDFKFYKDYLVPGAPNQAPVANAGSNNTLILPVNSTSLTGNGTDPDGTVSNYSWVKISGPAAGTIATANAAVTTINNLVQGVYQFQLTVTDNKGATGKDTVQITVNAVANIPPIANAGSNNIITLPVNSLTLSGSGTDADGTISSYGWKKFLGPSAGSIVNANAASTTLIGLVPGVYLFELTVTDNKGAQGKDTVEVRVNTALNQSPLVNAGADTIILLPTNSVTLMGNAVDADGIISSYSWVQIAGKATSYIATPDMPGTVVSNLAEDIYEYELTVTDDNGAISKDTIQVAVISNPNQPPVADAGTDQSINLPVNATTLTGSGTDPDGVIQGYSWVKISGPVSGVIATPDGSSTSLDNLVQGVYEFELAVMDNSGAVSKDTVKIIVNMPPNHDPIADAGSDQTITLPTNSLTLYGSAVDSDGTIAGYNWLKITGPSAVTIGSPGSPVTQISGLQTGLYEFVLTVKDNGGALSTDTIQVTVNAAGNQAPKANAGANQSITLPTDSTILQGSGIDSDGVITSYVWEKISGPAAGQIATPAAATTNIVNLVQGIYEFELTVTDNDGVFSTDTVRVTVYLSPNQPPLADAGMNHSLSLPTNSTTLTGSGTDIDGTIVKYVWAKISGPSTGSINSPNSVVTSVNSMVQGIYQFELTITDNDGAVSKDTVVISVNAAPNQAPVANGGTNVVVTLPVDSTTLAGSGTDADGIIVGYSWIQLSGPSAGVITQANVASAKIHGLVTGLYEFELSVTDNDGSVSKDTVLVTVNVGLNQAPIANAGPNTVISLPINSALLNGIGTDADGLIVSYAWVKLSGPAAGIIAMPDSAATSVDNLVQGVYIFELTVTDDDGVISKDFVQVTVNAIANIAPVADAGNDQSVLLPLNFTTLSGAGTDSDGSIASHTWVKISGPSGGTIASPHEATTLVNNLIQGIYLYRLTVKDDNGATSADTVQVTVSALPNQAPLANAGADMVITLPANTASLNGSGTDVDGLINSYTWTKISGPVPGTIASPGSGATSIHGLVQGMYLFALSVTDNDGAIAKDTVKVTVNAAPNQVPLVDAGTDQLIDLPINSTNLSGSATDIDGTISNYVWTQISGPSTSTIASKNAASTAVNNLALGVYEFELTVTDNDGAVSKDTVEVTVNSVPNQPPVADAGTNKVITLPVDSTILTGSGTDADGTVTSYTWAKLSGPAAGTIQSPNVAVTSVKGLVQGLYQFELTVTDNDGAVSSETVQVTVSDASNQAPVANAGANRTITLPNNSITLSGIGTDADGTIVSYSWAQISGPAAGTIVSPNAAISLIDNLIRGTYNFELTVTDNDGAISKDIVRVRVNGGSNLPPVAIAGTDKVITLPTNNTTLTGSGTDADGTIASYSWVKVSGPAGGVISSPNSATSLVTNLRQGIYLYMLTVKDNKRATSGDTIQITVNAHQNQAPVANAGSDRMITLPANNISLTGGGTDVDGTIDSYAWVKISGPVPGSISSPGSSTTSIINMVQGRYEFVLTVTDNDGAISKDTVQVTVNAAPNQPPLADAGTDQVITLPADTTTLSGNGMDSDGNIAGYSWIMISGPAAGIITSPNTAASLVASLVQGNYIFELTVTDNDGAASKDTVEISVKAAPNQAPVANAGNNLVIALPVNSITLNGTGTDADGSIAGYSWVKISGPAAGQILSKNSANTVVSNLIQGAYQFELTVTDNNGAISRDIVQVIVNALPNQAPVANAGSDQLITLPVNSSILTGSGTDPDGTIAGNKWLKLSGPAGGTIVSQNSATSSVNNLIQGIYFYQLTVTDNNGAVSNDTVKITVNAAPNQPPVANAGIDKTVTLPTQSSILTGSGTDADGTIDGYAWVKVSGPVQGSIASPNSGITAINNLVQGLYQFQITVTDNRGATSRDTMYVIVNAAPNQAPLANAGTDKVITLPANSTTLTGIGTDADGTISGYAWVQISGPAPGNIVSPNSGTTMISNLLQGVYQFQLTVTDNSGAISNDVVKVNVNAAPNLAPVANAGSDKSITLPANSTILTGIGSDPDGTIAGMAWVKISGPSSGIIASPNTASTTINNLVQGVYQYQFTVTDNNGAFTKDTVKVTVNAAPNQAPVANAGMDKVITLPTNSATLTGTGTDTDGTIAAYSWVKISGPVSGSIGSPNSGTTAINNLVQGVYEYKLTVTDNNGAISRDTVKITVNAIPNQAPLANAGIDKVITLPANSTTLSGTGTDTDGTITGYAWVKISGPASGNIGSPNSGTTLVNNLVPGVYQFQLTVTDNKGAISKDVVKVTVNAEPNQAPVANAGSDKSITLPTKSTTLTGSGTDADGTIVNYEWIQIAGPGSGIIGSPASATTSINGLIQGVYEFQLKVTDNNGAVSKDTVKVTVNAATVLNRLPVAVAGADVSIVLPTNKVLLKGAGSDSDGTIVSYTWKVINGPAGYLINTPHISETNIENLFQGVYEIELTVVDDDGALARDTLSITVSGGRLSNTTSNEFVVYPNPVINIANISISTTNANSRVSLLVYDLGGKIVKQEEFQTTASSTSYQLDMSNLSNGYYIISLQFEDGQRLSSKILKNGMK